MSFFDPLSFVLGAGVGVGVGGGAIYMLKDRLRMPGGDQESAEEIELAQGGGSGRSSQRYAREMMAYFQHLHLPGKEVELTDILLEPRFLKPIMPKVVIEDDEAGIMEETDIYGVVPFLHDFPAVYASFNLETIALADLESGDRRISLLGVNGSGKSTALATIGLMALNRITSEFFKLPDSELYNPIPDDPNVTKEVMERRRKEYLEVQRRAVEQLRVVQKREEEMEAIEQRDEAINFSSLLPIYVYVRHLDLNPETYGGSIDPVEPIIGALSHYASGGTVAAVPPVLYRALRSGSAVLLIDGYDDLTSQEREPVLEWLRALTTHYGQNFMVMTGPECGYDPLLHLDFAPAFMAPLNTRRFQDLIQKWLSASTVLGASLTEADRQRIMTDNRNRTIMDVTMKIWSTLGGKIQQTGRRGYYDAYLQRHIGEIEEATPILKDIAVHWLETGLLPDGAALKEIANAHLNSEGKASKVIEQLGRTHALLATPDGSLAFRYPALAWYLAGETLAGASDERLRELAGKPLWHGALAFATALVDLTPAVLRRLQFVQERPELLYQQVFSVVDWMADTPQQFARWRQEVIKRIRGVLLSPSQFPAIREYALAAMVTSRENEGVTYIFREAVRSGNSHIRTLGCLGLGALGSGDTVNDLKSMLVDEVIEVQLAAGLALGAIGNDAALDVLAEALLEGEENLRRAVAEALAAVPGIGYETLMEGITADDMMVRRASAFGLARIPEIWALVALYRAMLEDPQWYVRSAAEMAFSRAREPRKSGPQVYPEPNRYEWLLKWAAARGEAVPEGLQGRQMLLRALQEAPLKLRIEAAKALGLLGHVPAVKSLYNALGDNETAVRVAAFKALGDMSNRFGASLPGLP